jgi:dienelactone hydrolase
MAIAQGMPVARWRLAMISIVALLAMSASQNSRAQETESVSLPSQSYRDFRQVFVHEPPAPATVTAKLSFPEDGKARHPAIVIVHTIVGYQEWNEGWFAAECRKAGFATLTYDSFASRGLTRDAVVGAKFGPPYASAVADAYAALRFLSDNPKIDATQIAIAGFSFGGEVAHLTAMTRMHDIFDAQKMRFAAHVAWYPAGVYGTTAEKDAYTGAPILMLLGEKDDNLPIAKMTDYLTYAKAAGYSAPIETLKYDAYHAWTVSRLPAPRFYPEYASARKCPFILFGPLAPALLVAGHETPFDLNAFGACIKEGQGYSLGYDEAMRAKSAADALAFLREHLNLH